VRSRFWLGDTYDMHLICVFFSAGLPVVF